ncbi:ABC-type multidrug transport system fused ATPase/permease subunit [Bradyrhizobium sp. USDA 4474]
MAELNNDVKTFAARRATVALLLRLLRLASLPRWVTAMLVALGLVSSLAETVGITLVLLFFYLAMGQVELATSTGGLLGQTLGHAAHWLSSPRLTAAVIFCLIVIRASLAFLHSLISAQVGEKINEFARNAVHRRYLSTSYRFFQKHDEAQLMEVLGTETWLISGAYASFTKIVVSICSIALFTSFLLGLSVSITIAAVLASLVVSTGLRSLAGPVRVLGAEVRRIHQQLGERMLMTLQAMRTIRAYGQERIHQRRFESASSEAHRASLGLAKFAALVSPLTETGYLLVLCLIIALANALSIGFATTLTAVALLYRLQPHIRELEGNLLYLAQIEPQLRSIYSMLTADDDEPPRLGHIGVGSFSHEISFEEVSFRYRPDGAMALDRVSFRIPAGKTTALIGASGSGKTTIVNLLLRLYSADAGAILIDGSPLEELRRRDWLSILSVAGQDIDLIEGTVIDNVRMANESASHAQILEALAVASISDFIESLPEKYDTWVGQQGLRFSGGQRQRIGLARAVLRNPQFLILDEALSALDRDLEESVRRAIDARFSDRTILLITHRLETVVDADHVICVDAGRVSAEGSPSDLLRDSDSPLFKALMGRRALIEPAGWPSNVGRQGNRT